jgi:PII-like signaling protein
VNDDCLELTTYFGERQRSVSDVAGPAGPGGRFLAEAMLELYDRSEVATSVMLRGIAGFGPHHLLRTDESLSQSEDPPVAVAAVDTRAKISELIDEVVEMTQRGLVTIQRARLVGEEAGPFTVPKELKEAVKLTIYVGRQERVLGVPAHYAVCDLLHRQGLAGASVFLGVDGTAFGQRHRARFFSRNVDVPVMIIAVGTGEQVTRAVPELAGLLSRPLLTVDWVRVCKRDGTLLARPHPLPAVDEQGLMLWQKLTVYTSEATRYDGVPIHRALIRRLRQSKTASGATALRGIWGFHGDHAPHGDKLIQLSRRVPVTTIIVDTPERIARSFDIVDEVTGRDGLVTSEMVPALIEIDGAKRRGGTRLSQYRY